MRFLADRSPPMSAPESRTFWQTRGMRELDEVVSAAWAPLDRAGVARDACLFRIASLLGSRASTKALADELDRLLHELGEEAVAMDQARAAHAIAGWFDEAARA